MNFFKKNYLIVFLILTAFCLAPLPTQAKAIKPIPTSLTINSENPFQINENGLVRVNAGDYGPYHFIVTFHNISTYQRTMNSGSITFDLDNLDDPFTKDADGIPRLATQSWEIEVNNATQSICGNEWYRGFFVEGGEDLAIIGIGLAEIDGENSSEPYSANSACVWGWGSEACSGLCQSYYIDGHGGYHVCYGHCAFAIPWLLWGCHCAACNIP